MELTESIQNGIVIIEVKGRLDATSSGQFETLIVSNIDRGNRQLVVDLSGLEYISSIGLRVFLMAAKKLNGNGFIRLAALQPQVFDVFHMSGFNTILPLFNNKNEALTA